MSGYRITLSLVLAVNVSAQYCGWDLNLLGTQSSTITSLRHSKLSPPSGECLWTATSPTHTVLQLTCSVFDLQQDSPECKSDALLLSPSGDPKFKDAVRFCGSSMPVFKTKSNVFSGKLVTSSLSNNVYSRLQCQLSVIGNQTSIVQPHRLSCRCGVLGFESFKNKPVEMRETGFNEWPWQAGLLQKGSNKLLCGATLIDHQWLVTAAHCVVDFVRRIHNIVVTLGDHNITSSTDTTESILVGVDKVIIHNEFDFSTNGFDNDIALLHLSFPVRYSSALRPVCLPFSHYQTSFEDDWAVITGWGSTAGAEKVSSVLLESHLQVIADSLCSNNSFTQTPEFTANTVLTYTDNMICTLIRSKNSCSGDPGGPLSWQSPRDGRVYLVGVVSWYYRCTHDNTTGVQTRVTNYLDWIQKNTKVTFCIP